MRAALVLVVLVLCGARLTHLRSRTSSLLRPVGVPVLPRWRSTLTARPIRSGVGIVDGAYTVGFAGTVFPNSVVESSLPTLAHLADSQTHVIAARSLVKLDAKVNADRGRGH
jgi:hypothetical protein